MRKQHATDRIPLQCNVDNVTDIFVTTLSSQDDKNSLNVKLTGTKLFLERRPESYEKLPFRHMM